MIDNVNQRIAALQPYKPGKPIEELARELGISVQEGDFSLTQLYTADEAFTTGTMGGLAHIAEVDGRRIGPAERQGPGPLTLKLQVAYPSRIPFVTLPFS